MSNLDFAVRRETRRGQDGRDGIWTSKLDFASRRRSRGEDGWDEFVWAANLDFALPKFLTLVVEQYSQG